MPAASTSDVVSRSRLTASGTEFMVICGATSRLLGGPFADMSDAVGFAMQQATDARTRLLYEAHDERGRVIGERLLLRTSQAGQ